MGWLMNGDPTNGHSGRGPGRPAGSKDKPKESPKGKPKPNKR